MWEARVGFAGLGMEVTEGVGIGTVFPMGRRDSAMSACLEKEGEDAFKELKGPEVFGAGPGYIEDGIEWGLWDTLLSRGHCRRGPSCGAAAYLVPSLPLRRGRLSWVATGNGPGRGLAPLPAAGYRYSRWGMRGWAAPTPTRTAGEGQSSLGGRGEHACVEATIPSVCRISQQVVANSDTVMCRVTSPQLASHTRAGWNGTGVQV